MAFENIKNKKMRLHLSKLADYFEGFMDREDAEDQAVIEFNSRIARACSTPGVTQVEVARFFGVNTSTINGRWGKAERYPWHRKQCPAELATSDKPLTRALLDQDYALIAYRVAKTDERIAQNKRVEEYQLRLSSQRDAERAASEAARLRREERLARANDPEYIKKQVMAEIDRKKANDRRSEREKEKWLKEKRTEAMNVIINRERRKAFNEGRRLPKEEEKVIVEAEMVGWLPPSYPESEDPNYITVMKNGVWWHYKV